MQAVLDVFQIDTFLYAFRNVVNIETMASRHI